MNVQPGDLAILVKPMFPENQDRICTVLGPTPADIKEPGTWWLCEFPYPVKTTGGTHTKASIEDKCLRRIAGPSVPMGTLTAKKLKQPSNKQLKEAV